MIEAWLGIPHLVTTNIGGNTMSTFTIKMYADAPNTWEVDLGKSILEGMTDEAIRQAAEDALVVKLQAKIRGNKKIEDKGESIETYLKKDYPNVAVGEYVAKPSAAKMSAEQMLAKILSGEIKLTDAQKAELAKLSA